MTTSVIGLGWGDFFEQHFEPFRQQGLIPARAV